MALRAVPDHPKFVQLQVALNQPKWAVLGALECIWHFTGRFTPQGNIGKYSDEVIERWCEWGGAPGSLVRALTETGWIDPDEKHRLIVHDWSEHADKATRMSLSRSGLPFIVPTPFAQSENNVPASWGLPVPEPVPVPEPEPETEPEPEKKTTHTSPDGSCGGGSKPFAVESGKRKESGNSRIEAEFSEVWPRFWIRAGRGAAKVAWRKARKKAPRDAIEAAIVAQGPGILALAKSRGSTPVHPATWLNQERWEDDVGGLAVIETTNHGSKTEQAMGIFDELMMKNFERSADAERR